MYQVTRKFRFEAAHRLLGHQGKCKYLHGHSYLAEVTLTSNSLDSLGMLVDFAVLKERVGKWIEDNWDHNILLNQDDPLWSGYADRREVRLRFGHRDPFIMECNPTAESMAKELFSVVNNVVDMDVGSLRVVKVVIHETENCSAEYSE